MPTEADLLLEDEEDLGASEQQTDFLQVATGTPKMRADKVLAEQLPDVTRAEVQRWFHEGKVRLGDRVLKAKDSVQAGDGISFVRSAPRLSRALPDPSVRFGVLYEDDELLVVDKPSGLVVHPGRGHETGTLVGGLLARPGFEHVAADPRDPSGYLRPGIVHRIDRDTSGVLVVAKTSRAREGLKLQFAEHTIERVYQAITVGVPKQARIETLHGRDPVHRLRFSSKVTSGKRAITEVRPLEIFGNGRAAFVECRLETGRTHQIRVHLSLEANTPILADDIYGGLRGSKEVSEIGRSLGRVALHARVLGFIHPVSGNRLRFEQELPADLQTAASALRTLNGPV